MVYGIGIDIAQIDRFESFENRSQERLLAIYSIKELKELDNYMGDQRQFFASRFAAKEAFYKALSNALITLGETGNTLSFEFVRKHVEVERAEWDIPVLNVNWDAIYKKVGKKLPSLNVSVSISHEKTYAIAIVLLEG